MVLPGLRSLPFWTSYDASSDTNRIAYQDPTLTHVVEHLQANVETIRQEYHRVAPSLDSDYNQHDNEHSLHQGKWDWHSYMTKGVIQGQFATKFPETTQILQTLRQTLTANTPKGEQPSWLLLENIPFGYSFFSTLHPQSSIQAHTSPMNLRWRIHLPLEVPANSNEIDDADGMPLCGIRVGQQVQTWTQEKALVLDDSYDHEVWNRTNHKRVLFLLDIWHPDIPIKERKDIVGMFQHAQEQGWYSK
ncbi:asparaginyl beta-hydroxylase [Seminavis robusta]|uniref:Asparaginyl beta-hydroxylase n=1 Tax=Seminavis robusta TaxID=568900 RepID=A0A9N8DAK1_9STRA|nr:asparaginyl beta-hydroxylase [Seminavis robusta]|eukprot:Sro54_g031780.1 asparaginyl beta-hydroxylase (247) ;mRNA; f:42510-43250